ncbi:carboxypeptidase-like regulatory domain-containing protein [Allomuricauda sp. F6463D]|uniref:carboxypeptidase-like regulatory domain-containing protein n=1 Tax=Allomuricauda sp. F6463D TaxID=2926409 RepID=UPI001FF681BA|nr:carboxypeptidase-like regulatory domain-containing protein [Muricauda sp. F6463D]MCK0160974.1 carboxypeptidase-like regulatory domain-containing protein [Muricauda sp. F6463D]
MKMQQLIYLIVFLPFTLFSQNNDIKGIIVDSKTGLGLPYVNIGIVNKGIGTVSDEYGQFILMLNSEISNESIVQISSIGFVTKRIKVKELKEIPNNKISLEEDIYQLNEVVVSVKRKEKYRDETIGFSFQSKKKLGYWRGDGSLGAELVTKIYVDKKTRKLNSFIFRVLENVSDSLLMRVNIYKGNTIEPKEKINKVNILHTITKNYGPEEVDLRKFGIFIDDDFMIGLELLKVYGNNIDLVLSASDEPGYSYRRYASQDKWTKFRGDAMSFSLNTLALVDDTKVENIKKERAKLVLHEQFEDNPLIEKFNVKNTVYRNISGMVFNDGDPLPNVTVKLGEFSATGTLTDSYGRYNIMAKVDDELFFSYLGMENAHRKVTENTYNLNINLKREVNELSNVTVTGREKKKRSQKELFEEYNNDEHIIKTGFGIIEKKTASIAMEVVDVGSLTSRPTDLIRLIEQNFSGVKLGTVELSNGGDNVAIFLRGRTSILNPRPAVYEVDGILYSEIPNFLNTDNIKRISKLAGVNATRKYGSIASGGLFIINTNGANFSPNSELITAIPNNRKETNLYKGDALSEREYLANLPEYLKDIKSSPSFESASKVYVKYKNSYSTSPYFFLDMINYFLDYWEEENLHEKIIEKKGSLFSKETKYLKALAYIYDAHGLYEKSMEIYERIYKLKPNSPQSFLNLARSYSENGYYIKSANIYGRYNYLLNQEFLVADVDGSHPIIVRNFNVLISNSGENILTENIEEFNDHDKLPIEEGTRVIFEWNDENASLELQFVDPKNRYFKWKNLSNYELGENLRCTCKEYIIDNASLAGKWLINNNYGGNTHLTPSYLKISIYKNYGSPSETKDVKLFRLSLKNVNQNLLNINI